MPIIAAGLVELDKVMVEKHPGFKRVQGRIAGALRRKNPSMTREEAHNRAGAILAASSRRASARAKLQNPSLGKV